ncbi:hypothetical protein GOP47_0026417 [Adiantum capillus-veneris]|nr:hypothetical protein GOP47_0026417 [Adiantum capillus-veneris]
MHVRRDCKNCNGFGGLRCTMCLGEGQVHYSTNVLSKAKRSSIGNLANDLLEGKEEITYYPPGYNAGYPLPYRNCPTCNGTGLATCQVCKGYLAQPQLCFDNLMDVPWKTWNTRRRTHPPQNKRLSENVKDPALAAFLLYERDEMETGVKYDEDTKAGVMASYLRDLEYDDIRDEVAMRQPGWERLQEALHILDPVRAKSDPVVIQDVAHYKARKRVEAEVASMEVPPRPAEFTEKFLPHLRERYGGKVEEKALSISEIRTMVEVRDDLMEKVLDAAWKNVWRQRKVEELVEEKISPFIEAEESGKSLLRRKQGGEGPSESAKVDEAKQLAEAAIKKSDKSQKVDKKKERQERLARQAAEREAALAKAKKT